MDENEAIDKIRKLLKLGQSPHKKEADAARNKAYELMQKYKISMDQIFDGNASTGTHYEKQEEEEEDDQPQNEEVKEEQPVNQTAAGQDATREQRRKKLFAAAIILLITLFLVRSGLRLIASGIEFIKSKAEVSASNNSSVQQSNVAPQAAIPPAQEQKELPKEEGRQQQLYPQPTVHVLETTRTTFVRAGPGNQFRIVARIPAGVRVNVVGRQGSWLEIVSKHGNPPGYVPYTDLKVPETDQSPAGENNNNPSDEKEARF